jgi:hypothetical protein
MLTILIIKQYIQNVVLKSTTLHYFHLFSIKNFKKITKKIFD